MYYYNQRLALASLFQNKKIKIVCFEKVNNSSHYTIYYSVPYSSVIAVRDMIILEKCEFSNRENTVKVMKIIDRGLSYYIAFLLRSLDLINATLHILQIFVFIKRKALRR